MSLQCHKNGGNIVMTCDVCGRRANSLRRVNGHWLNAKTRRKVTDGPAWVCQACLKLMRRNGVNQ